MNGELTRVLVGLFVIVAQVEAVFNYGIQMDAGSSGTRAYVYKFDERVFETLPPTMTQVSTEKLWSKKQKPGISTCVSDPAKAGESIKNLLVFASELLATEGVTDLSSVPVFLGATAGMRMLATFAVERILQSIRKTVSEFGFRHRPEWIRVLSGEEEGVFGWITINVLVGTLSSPSTKKSFGALDLGGASTQMTLQSNESILEGYFPLQIADMATQLYTHSYLYYGDNQARARQQKALTPGAKNPCLPRGHIEPSGVEGSSNWTECLRQTSSLFKEGGNPGDCQHADHLRCTFDGVYAPAMPAGHVMYGMSSFYYTWSFFNLTTDQDPNPEALSSDLDALYEVAERVCNMDAKGQAAFNNSIPYTMRHEDAIGMCFMAAYAYSLLHVGYGYPTAHTPVRMAGSINGTNIGWAYGAILWEINNRIEWHYRATDNGAWHVGIYSLLLGVLLTATAFVIGIVVALFISRYSAKKEQELVQQELIGPTKYTRLV